MSIATDSDTSRNDPTMEVPLAVVLETYGEWVLASDSDRDRAYEFLGRGRVDLHFHIRRAFPALAECAHPAEWDERADPPTFEERTAWVASVAEHVGWTHVTMRPFA